MRDFLKKVVNFAQNHPVILGAFATALVGVTLANAWGPNRDTFTIQKPATRVVFNSITNNPEIGDERNFVRIRNLEGGQWSDDLKINQSGDYVVRMYVHNNAADNLNLVATGTTAKFNVPTYSAKKIQIDGFLSATNAQPGTVFDQAIFTSDKNFTLKYVAGSAKYTNNVFTNGVKLSDSVVNGGGTLLGYDKLDGKIPGCFKYSGWVTFTVRAEVGSEDFTINKTVRKSGSKEWLKSIEVNNGDTVDYQIEFKNTGQTQLNNVIIKDQLPEGAEIVKGSVWLKNASNPKGLNITEAITTGGTNIGHYTKGSNAFLKLTAKINDKGECQPVKTFRNVASATTAVGKKESHADVVIKKQCTPPTPTPTPTPTPEPTPEYKCSALTIKEVLTASETDATTGKVYTKQVFEFNTAYSVKNTEFVGVKYIVKDSTGKIVSNKTVNGGSKLTFTVQSYKSEKYTVSATVITKNGNNTNANCEKTFETKAPEQPKPKLVCQSVVISKISRTKFEFTTNYTSSYTSNIVVTYEIRNSKGQVVKTYTNNGSKFTVEINISGTYTVVAKISGNNGEISTTCQNQFVVEEEPKTETPNISISKTVNGKDLLQTEAGKDFNYEITVRNTGNVNLSDVTVTDKAPANIKFIGSDKGEIKNNTLAYKIASLKVGESQTITIKAQATAANIKAKNIACVNTTTIPGDNDGCDSADVEVPSNPTPETPTPEIPAPKTPPTVSEVELPKELPKTGIDGFNAILAISSLTTAFAYYIASRRMI